MASKRDGDAKVTTCCLDDIKSHISPEKLPFYRKEQFLYYCKELRLKTTGEKKADWEIIATWKVSWQITFTFSFSTAVKPTEIPPPSAHWKVLGQVKDVFVPAVTDRVPESERRGS